MSDTATEAAGQPTSTDAPAPSAPEQAQAPAVQQAPEPVTQDRLEQMLDGFSRRIGTRLDGFEQRLPEPEPEPEQWDAPQFEPGDYTETGELSPEASMRAMRDMMRQVVKDELAPMEQQRVQEQRDTYADQLEQRYPALRDQATQEAVIEETVRFAEQLGRPDLAGDPRLLEQMYLARLGRERTSSEAPMQGGQQQGAIEPERGAAPAAPAPEKSVEDSLGDEIVSLAQRQHHRVGVKPGQGLGGAR